MCQGCSPGFGGICTENTIKPNNNNNNSVFPAHQSQTKYFRKTFRQMYLWPHQLQKTNDKKSNLCCMKKRDCSTDANLKTVRANFLTRLHRTWVWWTRTKKRKLNRFSVQNLETIDLVRVRQWGAKQERWGQWQLSMAETRIERRSACPVMFDVSSGAIFAPG